MGVTKLNITIADQALQRIRLAGQSSQNISLVAPVSGGSSDAKISIDTTQGWNQRMLYIPKRGEFVVYSDRNIIDGIEYPGVKIGDGLAYVVDLPFLNDDITNEIISIITEHINDKSVHITDEEREFWNNKLNYELSEETLILNRL